MFQSADRRRSVERAVRESSTRMTRLQIATAVFALLCACVAGWLIALRRLFAHLRDAHPALHAELDWPSALVRNARATQRSMLLVLMTSRHKRLHDPCLARYGRTASAWLAAVVVGGIAAITLACVFPPVAS